MRLSLNGWPPLASHLACLLLGASIANLHKRQNNSLSGLSLASGTIALILNKQNSKNIGIEDSKKIYVAMTQKDTVCLLQTAPVEIIDSGMQRLIKVKLSSAKSIVAITEGLIQRNLALVGSANVNKYKKCREMPRIRYGER